MSSHRSNVPEELCVIQLQLRFASLVNVYLQTHSFQNTLKLLSWRAKIYQDFKGIISLVKPVKVGSKKNICKGFVKYSPGTGEIYKRGKGRRAKHGLV